MGEQVGGRAGGRARAAVTSAPATATTLSEVVAAFFGIQENVAQKHGNDMDARQPGSAVMQ